MKTCCRLVFLFATIFLITSCEDRLDTSSSITKEHSITQMMVGIYPENQKIFQQALDNIYQLDQEANTELSKEQSIALTNSKINNKTIEEVLHMAHLARKNKALAERLNIQDEIVITKHVAKKPFTLIKASFATQ